MDVLINKLSLDGQFLDKDNFLDNLEDMLITIRLLDSLKISLLKNYTFFDSNITSKYNLSELIKSKDSRIRKLKSFLLKLANNPPFWNNTQIHDCDIDKYIYRSKNICDTSLAESSQRDKVVLSFMHNNYLDENFKIEKNNDKVELYNLINRNSFLKYLLDKELITPLEFCLNKYKNSNLNFTKLENNVGFDLLNIEQVQAYLNSFMKFSLMTWKDIDSDGGFQYKPYNGDIFKNTNYSIKKIKKFRISQLYRCFGYREDDIFYVLRFEIDHKISDKG